MIYEQILIRYGELALKGKNRSHFEKTLVGNMKKALKVFPNIKINRMFGRITIDLNNTAPDAIVEKLKTIFGIHSFSLALKVENELEAIQKGALKALQDRHEDVKTFKISARRVHKQFPIDSQKLNHLIGGYVLKNTDNITVDVHQPDVEIKVEVRETATYITCGDISGAGGLPVGTAGKVMLMLSGGIDSPVAGYLALKRGVRIEALHFHSPPFTNERAKEKVKDLTKILTKYGGDIRLHLIPFTKLQMLIHEKVPDKYEMTITRRMMLRIAEQIALKNNALAIANGESLGQVASQTLHSMNTINEVTNLPIIRPLVAMDKVEVIELARKIGTYETSILPFEDCCTIFLPPQTKTKPRREQANKLEAAFNYNNVLEETIEATEVITVKANEEETSIEDLF